MLMNSNILPEDKGKKLTGIYFLCTSYSGSDCCIRIPGNAVGQKIMLLDNVMGYHVLKLCFVCYGVHRQAGGQY